MITSSEIRQLEKLEQSISGLNSVVFSWDIDSKELVYINRAYEDLIGSPLEKVYSDPSSFIEHIHPQDKIKTLIGFIDLLENKKSFEGEFRIIDQNNEIKWVEMKFFHEKTETELHGRLSGQIVDITKWKVQSEHLASQLKKNEESLYILVHDIRGPLQSLKSIDFLLKENLKSQNWEELSGNLQLLGKVNADTEKLVNHVLEMIKLEQGLSDLQIEETDIVQLIYNICLQFQPLCLEKSVHLEFKPELDSFILSVDKIKFRQVIQNLISNALKFTERNGLINISMGIESDYFVIKVVDTGIGISENHLPIIFEKFTKARRKGTKGEDTTGLGLAMVKEIVEAHHGEVKVISQENIGTTFSLYLPFNKNKNTI